MQIRNVNFDSFGEFLDYCETAKSDWQKDLSSVKGKKDFTGTNSIGEAFNLARSGWVDGIHKLGEQLEIAERGLVARSRARRFDVDGDDFDVESFIEGSPELFEIEEIKETNKRRTVRLRISGAYHCGITTAQATAYGAAVTALVRAIEDGSKTRCELVLEYPADSGGVYLSACVTLKQAGDALDLLQVAFPLIHPSSHRRVNFAFIERALSWKDASKHGWIYGYGHPTQPRKLETDDENTFILPTLTDVLYAGDSAAQRAYLVKWWNENGTAKGEA